MCQEIAWQKPPVCTLDAVPVREAPTLPRLLEECCARNPGAEACRRFDAAKGVWRGCTWQAMRGRVGRWRAALAREQLAAGERVALMLPNRVEWICFDLAAQSLGLVVAPLHPDKNPVGVVFQLSDSGARLLLLGAGRDCAAPAAKL